MDPQVGGFVTDPILTQVTVSGIVVWLLDKLKSAKWFPMLSAETTRIVQTAWGVIAAFISALGIQYSFDATAGSLIVTGLTMAGVGGAFWAATQSFVVQQLIYHGVVKPAAPSPSAVVEAAIKEVQNGPVV